MNHLTLGIYANGSYKFNVVREDDLINHIEYNKMMRCGRLLYVDGNRVYDGCNKSEYLEKFDAIADEFYNNSKIDMSVDTIPYR